MALVTGIVLPNDGDRIKATNYNDPINKILAQLNGNLDSTNIASLTGTKLSSRSVPVSAMDDTVGAGWIPSPDVFTYGANNGQKEFTATTPNDQTGRYSVGMKMKLTRGTPPPTQCMSFAGASSQYATKASPAGISFTSAFTCEAWIYLNSYTGQTQAIISRTDGSTGGWQFVLNSSGQLYLQYGSASTFTNFQSYQSIPLKRWVHVAGVVTSVASKTGALYVSGVQVPSTSTLTAATALTQVSANLTVAGVNAGVANNFLDGFISEARVWSVAQSQAQIQANMGISIAAQTGLVFAAPGNGNFNDISGNNNNLTATNGAIATQAVNPYNPTEYAIITKVAFAAGTTTLTLFTGTDYMIPSLALSNPQYSTQRAPYGFPADKGKWVVDTLFRADVGATVTVNNTWVPHPASISIPTGAWRYGMMGNFAQQTTGTAGARSGWVVLAPSAPPNTVASAIDGGSDLPIVRILGSGTQAAHIYTDSHKDVTLNAQTVYTSYGSSDSITTTETTLLRAAQGAVRFYAECAYV